MKTAIELADALVTELNSTSFSEPLVISRRVLPEFELADLKALTVTVVPQSVQITNLTRQSSNLEVSVDIGIQQKIGKDTDADVARLSGVVSEIVFFLNRKQLTAAPTARFVSIRNEPVYVPEHLSEQRLFTSILTLTYRTLHG